MSRSKLILPAVVAAIAVGAALWSTQTRRPVQEADAATPLVPGLQQKLNDVTALRVIGPGNATLATIERGDAAWTLKERAGYPVDTAKVRDLLVALAGAKRVEQKTASPELYGKLGVADIAQADATGTQVEVDGLGAPVQVILGQNVARGTGTFVRTAGEAQSWQIDGNVAVERAPAKWLQPEIVDIAPARIEAVSIKPAEGAAIEIARADGKGASDFVLKNLPKGREAESEFGADAAAGLLSGLRLDDVAPAADAAPGDAKVTTATFHVEDGTIVTLTAWKANDRTLAQLAFALDEGRALAFVDRAHAREAKEAEAAASEAAASANAGAEAAAQDAAATDETPVAAAAPGAAQPPATPAASDPAADREQRLAALRTATDALQAKVAPWTYTLPTFKASNLNKTLEDYLKPKG